MKNKCICEGLSVVLKSVGGHHLPGAVGEAKHEQSRRGSVEPQLAQGLRVHVQSRGLQLILQLTDHCVRGRPRHSRQHQRGDGDPQSPLSQDRHSKPVNQAELPKKLLHILHYILVFLLFTEGCHLCKSSRLWAPPPEGFRIKLVQRVY